jgi:Uma2 family endonuclease
MDKGAIPGLGRRAGRRGRYEVDGARPVAMAPATLGHNEIARNIRETIRGRLPAGTRCRVYGPQQPIETVGGARREPEAFIACSAPGRTFVAISAPIVVFEVLPPGKENRRRDEEEKVDEYGSVPTILRYVLVDSDPLDEAGPLHLPEFGVTLTFDQISEGVVFD